MAEIIRARFVLELGRAIKPSLVDNIKNEAFMRGLDLNIEESGGILSCIVRFELKGKRKAVDRMLTNLQKYLFYQQGSRIGATQIAVFSIKERCDYYAVP